MSLEVLRPGPLALVQDAGRPGLAALGVSPSGAADRAAFVDGALLVGNDPARHAAVEVTLGGLSVRAVAPVTVALTGADCPARVDDEPAPWGEPFRLVIGATLTLGLPRTGLRSYLSVAGGIAVTAVLGSRSTDILSGLGPPRLAAGTVLPVGRLLPEPDEEPSQTVPAEVREERTKRHEWSPPPPILGLLPGPRTGWLSEAEALATTWTVSPESNRVGIRLTGSPLTRALAKAGAELPSEPLVRGAVQLPPSGLPVIFGPDHPTTGGYPVVAVLTDASSDRLAQCRPGDTVTLVWSPVAPTHELSDSRDARAT